MTVFVVAGFWPSYFGPLARQALQPQPLWLHLHAAIFMGWFALLVAQAFLVSSGRTDVHKRLGVAGVGYGVLMIISGLTVSFLPALHLVPAGHWSPDFAARVVVLGLGDVVPFTGFFGAAIWWRKRRDVHKRLVLLAAVAVSGPGVWRLVLPEQLRTSQMAGESSDHLAVALMLLVGISPIILAAAYDFFTRRRIHPVYLIGTPILLLFAARAFFLHSEVSARFGYAFLAPLM